MRRGAAGQPSPNSTGAVGGSGGRCRPGARRRRPWAPPRGAPCACGAVMRAPGAARAGGVVRWGGRGAHRARPPVGAARAARRLAAGVITGRGRAAGTSGGAERSRGHSTTSSTRPARMTSCATVRHRREVAGDAEVGGPTTALGRRFAANHPLLSSPVASCLQRSRHTTSCCSSTRRPRTRIREKIRTDVRAMIEGDRHRGRFAGVRHAQARVRDRPGDRGRVRPAPVRGPRAAARAAAAHPEHHRRRDALPDHQDPSGHSRGAGSAPGDDRPQRPRRRSRPTRASIRASATSSPLPPGPSPRTRGSRRLCAQRRANCGFFARLLRRRV